MSSKRKNNSFSCSEGSLSEPLLLIHRSALFRRSLIPGLKSLRKVRPLLHNSHGPLCSVRLHFNHSSNTCHQLPSAHPNIHPLCLNSHKASAVLFHLCPTSLSAHLTPTR